MSRPVDMPGGLRASVLERDGEVLLVISYAIDAASLRGDTSLTPAEADVAAMVVRGCSNADIARSRQTSVRTVANQVAAILRKTGYTSRRELAARHVRGELRCLGRRSV